MDDSLSFLTTRRNQTFKSVMEDLPKLVGKLVLHPIQRLRRTGQHVALRSRHDGEKVLEV